MKHYKDWFIKLYKQYGLLTAIMCTPYNAKNYNIDGSYK